MTTTSRILVALLGLSVASCSGGARNDGDPGSVFGHGTSPSGADGQSGDGASNDGQTGDGSGGDGSGSSGDGSGGDGAGGDGSGDGSGGDGSGGDGSGGDGSSGDMDASSGGGDVNPDAGALVDASASDGADAGSAGGESDAGGSGPMGPDLRLNHVQVTGTHNSYHIQPLVAFDASHKYTHKPLDQQLEGGVRNFELDLHGGNDGKIHVYHITVIDDRTTCSTLLDCLGVIKGWSDAHPKHTPIFVWYEIKNDTGGTGINDVGEVDDTIRQVFGDDQIVKPSDVQGSYASPRARVEAEGWPKLADVQGKVMFILLNTDDLQKGYTHDHTSLDGRLMFVNTTSDQYSQPWALVSKLDPNDHDTATKALDAKMLTCTNVCSIDTDDATCEANLSAAVANGFHMLQDDLPFQISGRSYYLRLPNGSPGCNPVTAPAGCSASLLEK